MKRTLKITAISIAILAVLGAGGYALYATGMKQGMGMNTGAATTELKPGGIARFPYGGDARTTSVVSESGFVPAGTRVIVREVHGNRVVVRVL